MRIILLCICVICGVGYAISGIAICTDYKDLFSESGTFGLDYSGDKACSSGGFNPEDSCYQLKILSRNTTHLFRAGMYTSMKFYDDSVYIIAKIERISADSIRIFKREHREGEYVYSTSVSYPLNALKWINWDGIPRKKLYPKRHEFYVESRCADQ